jgi:hypothetical protein
VLTPVPFNAICNAAPLLATMRFPVAGPVFAASKVTVTLTVWLGVRVTFDPPLELKPAPDAETVEILIFEFPVLVSVTFWVSATPTVPFPKFTGETLGVSCAEEGTTVALMPICILEIGEPAASLTTATSPEIVPLAVDINAAEKLALWPAGRVKGSESPDAVNPDPDAVTWVMVRLPMPSFDSRTV